MRGRFSGRNTRSNNVHSMHRCLFISSFLLCTGMQSLVVLCVGGRYQLSTGGSECQQCGPNQYLVRRNGKCFVCPEGAYCTPTLVSANAGNYLVEQDDGQFAVFP